MTSRPEEGVAFLAGSREGWRDAHFMAGHNGWHLALYLIELGRFDEVLDGFDRHMAPASSKDDATLDRIDAASLLWRLELEGVDVGDRWAPGAQGNGRRICTTTCSPSTTCIWRSAARRRAAASRRCCAIRSTPTRAKARATTPP